MHENLLTSNTYNYNLGLFQKNSDHISTDKTLLDLAYKFASSLDSSY